MSNDYTENFAIWLLPEEKSLDAFNAIIKTLAHRFDAPTFGAHVTLYFGGRMSLANLESVTQDLARRTPPLQLAIRGMGVSPHFFKTFFVQFGMTDSLRATEEYLGAALQKLPEYTHAAYTLSPHMSLLYKDLPGAEKEKLLSEEIELPKHILFDRVLVSIPGNPELGFDDVESWQAPFTFMLKLRS